MSLCLPGNLRRALLATVMVVALALVLGVSALACGGDDGSGISSSDRDDERERNRERDKEDKEGNEGGVAKLLDSMAGNRQSEDTESTGKSEESSQPASSDSGRTGSVFSSISQGGIGSEAAFEFLPAPADGDDFEVEIFDIETILTDGRVPDGLRAEIVNSYSHLERSCIFLDEIDTVILYTGVSVVSGAFNLGDLRGSLENNGYTQETYRGYELWTGESDSLRYSAIAFPSDGSHVIIGRDGSVRDVLKALNRGSNLLSDSDAKRLLDRVGGGLSAFAGGVADEFLMAWSVSASDEDYAADVVVVSMAESARAAEAIAESNKTIIENSFTELLSIESKAYENFAVVEVTMDEKFIERWYWFGSSFNPAYYSEGELVEAYLSSFARLPVAAPPAPAVAGTPTPTPTPMCPSRSQAPAPAPQVETPAQSVSVPDEPLDLVPDYATEVVVYDTKAILTDDDVPSVFRDIFANNHDLLRFYLDMGEGNYIIPPDEVDKVVLWQGRGHHLIVPGGLDRNAVKDRLREHAFEQGEYRGFELWSFPAGAARWARTVAFLGPEHILISRNPDHGALEDILGKLSRGAGTLMQSDDSSIKRVMDKAGQGLTLKAGHDCIASGCSAYAFVTSTSSEDYAMRVKHVGLFGSGQEAEAGLSDMEVFIRRDHEVVRFDSRVDGKFVIVDAIVDEESFMPAR